MAPQTPPKMIPDHRNRNKYSLQLGLSTPKNKQKTKHHRFYTRNKDQA